jgi:hypothetical protein
MDVSGLKCTAELVQISRNSKSLNWYRRIVRDMEGYFGFPESTWQRYRIPLENPEYRSPSEKQGAISEPRYKNLTNLKNSHAWERLQSIHQAAHPAVSFPPQLCGNHRQVLIPDLEEHWAERSPRWSQLAWLRLDPGRNSWVLR